MSSAFINLVVQPKSNRLERILFARELIEAGHELAAIRDTLIAEFGVSGASASKDIAAAEGRGQPMLSSATRRPAARTRHTYLGDPVYRYKHQNEDEPRLYLKRVGQECILVSSTDGAAYPLCIEFVLDGFRGIARKEALS